MKINKLYKSCVSAKYGINDKMIDVTDIVIKKLVKNNHVIIPANFEFNDHFDDPAVGNIKFLILQINNKKHIMREGKMPIDIVYPINIYYKKITIVYYAFINPDNHWENIVIDQLIHLSTCGLLDIAEIYIHVTGEEQFHEYVINLIKTIIPQAIVYVSIENKYEYPGIHLVWKLAYEKPNNIFLYFHSKGMSYYTIGRRHDEKQIFQEVVLPWEKILSIFRDFSIGDNIINKIGFGSAQNGFMWFNFWWARGSYLIECEEPIISDNRWYYEEWISKKLIDKHESSANDCYSLADDVIGKIYSGDDICNKINAVILRNEPLAENAF